MPKNTPIRIEPQVKEARKILKAKAEILRTLRRPEDFADALALLYQALEPLIRHEGQAQ